MKISNLHLFVCLLHVAKYLKKVSNQSTSFMVEAFTQTRDEAIHFEQKIGLGQRSVCVCVWGGGIRNCCPMTRDRKKPLSNYNR